MGTSGTTADQLLAMPDDGRRCELVGGALRPVTPPGYRHGEVAAEVCAVLRHFVRPRRLGVVYAEAGFLLARDPDTVRAPDVAFVRRERVPTEPGPGYFPGPPDLAVEVVAPRDRRGDVGEKARCWLAAGCARVWIVDPASRSVRTRTSEGAQQWHGADDVLTAPDLLPCFRQQIAALFP